VCIRDLERASSAGPIAGKTVADIATTENLLTVTPDEPMWVALRRLGGRNIGHLPVVEGRGSRRLVGMVYRRGIIRAYNRAITKQAHHQHRDETLRLDKLDDAGFAQITVTPDAPVVGLRIREVDWPDESLIVSVRRGGKLYVARSYTSLQAQDQVTVFANNDCLPIVRQYLSGSRLVQREKVKHQARHREFTISAGGTCSGRQVQELSLPPECVLVSIRRGDEVIIPHRDTILQAGDVVEVFGLEADLKAVGTCLTK
jgi:Trk K+ transport system NAD-binding subunit